MDKVELAILALLKGDISLLKEQHSHLKEQYKKQNMQAVEPDLRTGEDTYGYENIANDLEYISDRWNCEFRIRWLLDGLEFGYFDKFIKEKNHVV